MAGLCMGKKVERIEVEGFSCEVRYGVTSRVRQRLTVLDHFWRDFIDQKPLKEAINFILNLKGFEDYVRESVKEFVAYPDDRILIIRSVGDPEKDVIFQRRWKIAKYIGWFPHITFLNLKESEISAYVNKEISDIEKRKELLEKIGEKVSSYSMTPITVEPITSSPSKNSLLLKAGEINILLDCGFDEEKAKEMIKETINIADIDLVLISHAHLDHIYALKFLFDEGRQAPIIATPMSVDLAILGSGFKDYSIFEPFFRYFVPAFYDEKIQIGGTKKEEEKEGEGEGAPLEITALKAGHIPGSAMFLLNLNGFKVLYTGDYYLWDHFPVDGALQTINRIKEERKEIDVLILDASFAHKSTAPKDEIKEILLEEAERIIKRKGNVLIGADSLGLSLDLITTFFDHYPDPSKSPPIYAEPIVFECMKCVKSRLLSISKGFQEKILDEPDPFSSPLVRELKTTDNLINAITSPSIIISEPNNFSNLPIMTFLFYLGTDEKSLIVLTGMQKKEPGTLIEQGKTEKITVKYTPLALKKLKMKKEKKKKEPRKGEGVEEEELEITTIDIKAQIFNLKHPDKIMNLHPDKDQVINTIKTINPRKTILFHNRYENLEKIKTEMEPIIKDPILIAKTKTQIALKK